jgi:hypothetical protein
VRPPEDDPRGSKHVGVKKTESAIL